MSVFFRGLKEKYNLSSHGGGIYFATDTKEIIQNGEVLVNGEVDTRRGRKLHPGDIFSWNGQEVKVEGNQSS